MAWDPLGLTGQPTGTGGFLGGLLFGPAGFLPGLFQSGSGSGGASGTPETPKSTGGMSAFAGILQALVPLAIVALVGYFALKYGKKLFK